MEMYDISVIEGAESEGLENGSAGASLEDSSVVNSVSLTIARQSSAELYDRVSALDGADSSLDSLFRSCIAVAWSWPWTVLYSVKTRKLFYFNETRQVLLPELPHGTSLRMEGTVSTTVSRRKLCSELLYRALSLTRDESLADVSLFSLSEKYFGISRSTPNAEESQGGRLSRKQRNPLSGLSAGHREDRRVFGGASPDPDQANDSTRSLAEEILFKSSSLPVISSSPSRPASSPSFNSSRPSSTVGSSRIRVSVGLSRRGNDESSYICFDSPHRASGVRSLVIEILSLLRDTENRVLKERIFRNHMLVAAQRQRRLFEGIRVIDKSRKFSDLPQVERLQSSGSVEESSPTYNSLSDMFSSLSVERLRESEFAFEKKMSIPEHNEYLLLLGDVSSCPSSMEAVLKLITHLLKCDAFEAAASFVDRVHSFLSTYQLNDVERSFVDLLHAGFSSKFRGHYPKIKVLKDLASCCPEDPMLLAFVALHLDRVGCTDDAETYFLASLIRDPRNQFALRGYAHLLSVKRSDYLAAIKYLSRIGTEPYHSDAPVAKLEMVRPDNLQLIEIYVKYSV